MKSQPDHSGFYVPVGLIYSNQTQGPSLYLGSLLPFCQRRTVALLVSSWGETGICSWSSPLLPESGSGRLSSACCVHVRRASWKTESVIVTLTQFIFLYFEVKWFVPLTLWHKCRSSSPRWCWHHPGWHHWCSRWCNAGRTWKKKIQLPQILIDLFWLSEREMDLPFLTYLCVCVPTFWPFVAWCWTAVQVVPETWGRGQPTSSDAPDREHRQANKR